MSSDLEPATVSLAPAVCGLAAFLAARYGADRIVNVRHRAWRSTHPIRDPVLAKSLLPPYLDEARDFCSSERWVDFDLQREALPLETIRRSVVVCGDLPERSTASASLQRVAWLSRSAVATIIASHERGLDSYADGVETLTSAIHHGRRTLAAFREVVTSAGMRPTLSGLTDTSALDPTQRTMVAVVDHCPLDAGRSAPNEFRPLALMATYNDLDIAVQTVSRLLDDGCDVYLRDNWSTDGTYEQMLEVAKRRRGLTVGRFPESGPIPYHDYLGLLGWKEEIASRHPGRWILSVDSDEIRCSPWTDVSFRGGLYIADLMGFNAVDLTVLNFQAIDNRFEAGMDPEHSLPYFEFGRLSAHFLQIKTWRQGGERVNLSESGGHEVRFAGRRVFPYKSILKHYPLRSTTQARRKVFQERKPRYAPETRAKGWQIQYDRYRPEDAFLRAPEELTRFEQGKTHADYMIELVSGIGVIGSRTLEDAAPPIPSAPPAPSPSALCGIPGQDSAGLLREKDALLEDLHTQVAHLTDTNRGLQAELKQLRTDADDARGALERARSESADLDITLTTEREVLTRVLSSRSWRLTRPLRLAGEAARVVLRGRRRALRATFVSRSLQWLSVRRRPQRRADWAVVASSRLFDESWYLQRYPDVAAAGVDPILHYLDWGVRDGRNPGPRFDGLWYLSANPDVLRAGMNPLVHYLRYGQAEGRVHRHVHEGDGDLRDHTLVRHVLERNGVAISLDFSAEVAAHDAWRGMIDTGWETGVFDFLAGVLREGDVFFDVGASLGPFAIWAARRVGTSGRVVAIEPDPLALSLLEHNLALNGCRNVIVIGRAIHDTDGVVGLRRREQWGDSKTRTVPAGESFDRRVEGVTLANLCIELGVCPSVLKMDIEGGERVLLDPETWAIVRAARAVALELHQEALGAAREPLDVQLGELARCPAIAYREIGQRNERNCNVAWVRLQ
jgi:FkbM family methyltransferase